MPEKIKLAPRALRTIFGVNPTKQGTGSSPRDLSFVHRYSKNEKTNLLSKLYVRQEEHRADLSPSGLLTYLSPTHEKVAFRSEQFKKLKALAPEIEQSAIIVASSILSPNDLKDGEFQFNFDKIPAVNADNELTTALSKLYSDYFNGTLQLGKESYNWLQEIIYVDGAKAILILPPAVQQRLRDRTDEEVDRRGLSKIYSNSTQDILHLRPGIESFTQFSAQPEVVANDYLLSGKSCSWKEYFTYDSLGQSSDVKQYLSEMVPAMESMHIPVPEQLRSSTESAPVRNGYAASPQYCAALESMVVNLRTRLQEGDMVRISENPELLRFNVESVLGRRNTISKRIHSSYGFNNERNRFPVEELVTLDVDPNMAHFGHPTLIKLPVESVIPVCVAGAPQEHLGYFIMLSENGTPLTHMDDASRGDSTSSSSGFKADGTATNMAYDALFGDNTWRTTSMSINEMQSTGSVMFNHILDGYIKTRLTNIYGRSDLTISRFNGIASVLFYRLLARKQTTLVFAYTDLLHYFAFDYHEDGTGYAKTEEIGFLVSMRTSFIIASIMSKARDAVVHKKVTIGTNESNTNIEGMMDIAYNVLNSKRRFNTTNINPDDIVNQMYADSVIIEPQNIPGLDRFEINTENVQNGGGGDYNSELVEQLTNFIATRSGVPPSALNQMSEPEYAKSLVTYNLFFAKRIMEMQKVYCKQMTEFIRAYVSFDPILQAAIHKAINNFTHRDTSISTTKKAKKVIAQNPNVGERPLLKERDLSTEVVFNTQVTLPNPNIVMDKARFAELSDFNNLLNDISDKYFSSALVPDSDAAAQASLNQLRAFWNKNMVNKFLNNTGSTNIIEPPKYDEINTDELVDFIQLLQNLNARLDQQRTTISNFPNDTRDNSPSDSFGGGGDDFGGGMDMGGLDDLDF